VRTVCGALSKPVNALAGRPQLSVADLTEAGVKRISLGGLLARAALGGLLRAAKEIKDHGTFGFAKDAAPGGEINAMMAEK
jgi:2-methylisocitrate lyase-like PEP mutase family enzyme